MLDCSHGMHFIIHDNSKALDTLFARFDQTYLVDT